MANEYEDNFAAIQQAAIPEFYVFSYGGVVERYTNYNSDLTFLGQTFEASQILRGSRKIDIKLGTMKLNLSCPVTDEILNQVRYAPLDPVYVTIYRSHIDYLSQYSVFFKGKIRQVRLNEKMVATLMLEGRNKILRAKIPMFAYQSFCNHDIYDSYCRVNPLAYRRIGAVSSLADSGRTINVGGWSGGSVSAGDLVGGKIYYSYSIRYITGHPSTNQLNIHVPFDSSFDTGTGFYVYFGCDGNIETCIDVFNNKNHFLGTPYIPSKNPVIWGF